MNSSRKIKLAAGVVGTLLMGGCSPVVSVAGATFPLWILCLLIGIAAALALRPLFVVAGLDEWMAPRVIVYCSLALVVASLCWLIAWR